MELLVYTIGGQKIGIDIQTWDDAMLSGNTAFLAIQDGGTIPTDYVDISSTSNWDNFGGSTTASTSTIKEEIIKLIPDTPTVEEYQILEGYVNVGINKMTNIDSNITMGSVISDGHLSGVIDTKFATSGGTVGSIGGESGVLNVSSHMNVAGNSALGGTLNVAGTSTMSGNMVVSGNMTVTGTIDNPVIGESITGATNLGTGEGLYTGVTNYSLQLKTLIAGTDVTLVPDANSITINASGGGTGGTITTYSNVDGGAATTTSATDVLMQGMQINSVPAGDYFISFGTSFNHSSNGDSIITSIYVGGTQVTNSAQAWTRGNSQGNIYATHNYAGFPITLASTATVEIRWQTTASTATSTNRYLSLLKVG